MKVIDFHAHVVPSRYPDRPASIAEPNWPSMETIDDRTSRMVIAGKQFRVFESFYWNVQERVARLDEEGITLQVISPLPELLSYWLAADAAEALTGFMNGLIAEMCRAAPQRFVGIGAVALQDPARALRQVQSLKADYGLKGIHVGSHVNGVSIADERFYPVYEAAESQGLVIFVHGIKPGGGALLLGPPLMPAVVGVPHETAMTISSFIMTDILGRFPRLKLVFSHGGGTLGSVIDRLDAVWSGFDVMRARPGHAPGGIRAALPLRYRGLWRRLPELSGRQVWREPAPRRHRRTGGHGTAGHPALPGRCGAFAGGPGQDFPRERGAVARAVGARRDPNRCRRQSPEN